MASTGSRLRILFAYDGPWVFVLKMDASGEKGIVEAVPALDADARRARGWHVMGTDATPLPEHKETR